MSDKTAIIDHLNLLLSGELVAINQYFLHAAILKDRGYDGLASVLRQDSIDEMKHAEAYIDRILYLGGTPNVTGPSKVNVGQTIEQMLENDKKLEVEALTDLRKGVILCEAEQDFATRALIAKTIEDEEEHLDWIERQQKIIGDIGVDNYLATKI